MRRIRLINDTVDIPDDLYLELVERCLLDGPKKFVLYGYQCSYTKNYIDRMEIFMEFFINGKKYTLKVDTKYNYDYRDSSAEIEDVLEDEDGNEVKMFRSKDLTEELEQQIIYLS